MQMRVRVRLALVAMLAALAVQLWAASPALAAQANLVQLPRGTTYQILEDGDSTAIRIPITLRKGLTAKDLTVEMLDIALGQLEQPALSDAFVPAMQPSTENRGAALIITVTANRGLRAGTYNALLAVHKPQSRATAAEEQRLQLQLSHPVAQLQGPSTLVIQQTRWFPFFSRAGEATPTTLNLRETTRDSRAGSPGGGLTIQQLDPAKTSGGTINGRLHFDNPVAVPAGKVAEQKFALDGDFPLGTATGTVLISAPQLQAPITVNFEVRTQLSPVWIVVVALAGLLIGWWIRVFLNNRIARESARRQAFEVLQKIDREAARRPDETFQQDVESIRNELAGKVDDANVQNISTATKEANDKLQTALNELERRRTKEQTEIDSIGKELNRGWSLPPGMRELLDTARTQLAEAEALLAHDDVAAATKKREQLAKSLVAELQESAKKWREALTPLVVRLASTDPHLDIGVAGLLTSSANQIDQQLNGEAISDPGATPGQVLLAINSAQSELDRILELLPQLRLTGLTVAGVLEAAGPTDPGAVAAIRTAADQLQVPPRGTAIDREHASGVAAAISTLHAKMRDGIEAELASVSAGDRKGVEDKLAEGRYQEAAQIAVHLPRAGKERLLGGKSQDAARVADAVGVAQAVLAARVPATGVSPSVQAPGYTFAFLGARDREPPLTVRLYRTQRALEQAQLLQSLFLAIVFSVVAYVLYAPTFSGTVTQLGAIFLWAFTSDLAVNAVVNAARATAPAPGSGSATP
jgi:hypothetical protein